MKKFKDFCINGDTLQVICTNTETGEDSVGCELDLSAESDSARKRAWGRTG